MRFEGKKAIVTGGSRGIGRAVAARLASEGAEVLVTGRSSEALEEAVRQSRSDGHAMTSLAADMADADAIDRIVETAGERLGRIDILINNAGTDDDAPFLEISKDNWHRVLAVNLTGPFLLAQAAARAMVSSGGGAIVNIASVDGHAADGPYASYCVSKAGLIALTRNIAVELARYSVRCNSVSPGYTETEMVLAAFEGLRGGGAGFPRAPQNRMLRPDEIAAACLFLVSDEASTMTSVPVMPDASSLTRKRHAAAISSGLSMRF